MTVETTASASGPAMRRPEREMVVLPTPGGPFAIAWHDVLETVRLAPVWLHAGWIDVVWRFRRTRLGPLWHTLGLGAFVLVVGIIWGVILGRDPVLHFRYVSIGLIVWSLIASFVTQGTGTFIGGKSTALSMRVPYAYFAFAQVWHSLLMFAHHFVLYFLVLAGTGLAPGWPVLLAVPALVLILANGVWISVLVGTAALRWRDLVPAAATAMQIAMFATPVFWPKEMLGPKLVFLADLNPLYHCVRILREPLLGTVPSLENWLWAVGTLVVGSLVTAFVYGRCRNRLPYWY